VSEKDNNVGASASDADIERVNALLAAGVDPELIDGGEQVADMLGVSAEEAKRETLASKIAGLPRVQVGPNVDDWINHNAQSSRDVSDRLGVTADIEQMFADGMTVAEAIDSLAERLDFLALEERREFVTAVRASLGIPSRISQEGVQDFEVWKAERDARLQGRTPVNQGNIANSVKDPDVSDAAPMSVDRLETAFERAQAGEATNDKTDSKDKAKSANSIGLEAGVAAEQEQPEQAAPTAKRKPVIDKSGYEIPKSVKAQYVVVDGKFVDRKSETVHFEDSGKKLSTESDDKHVIKHMVDVAKAKNWGTLELRGTEEFRRQAWIAAEVAGLETTGYKPTSQDRAAVEVRRSEMRISAGDRPVAHEGGKSDPNVNSISINTPQKDISAPTNQHPGLSALSAVLATRGESTELAAKALELGATKFINDRVYVGRVLDHSPAPYQNDQKNSKSYFVSLDTADGVKTIWGADLARNADEGHLSIGDDIALSYQGRVAVVVPTKELDATGRETGNIVEIETHRNTWDVISLDKLRDDFLGQSAPVNASNEQGGIVTAGNPPEVQAMIDGWKNQRTAELRAELVLKHSDPAYRREYAENLLREYGRDPNASPTDGNAKAESTNLELPARSATEPPSTREAALRATLEQEMVNLNVPEGQRGQLRASLDTVLATARSTGQDLHIPEPMTVDRVEPTKQSPSVEVTQPSVTQSVDIQR